MYTMEGYLDDPSSGPPAGPPRGTDRCGEPRDAATHVRNDKTARGPQRCTCRASSQPTKHNISTVRITTSNGVGKASACEATFCARKHADFFSSWRVGLCITTSNGVGKARAATFCASVTTQSVTCEPGGRVGLASNATPMHLNLHALNMLTPFRAGRAGGARKFASLSGLVRAQGLSSPTRCGKPISEMLEGSSISL